MRGEAKGEHLPLEEEEARTKVRLFFPCCKEATRRLNLVDRRVESIIETTSEEGEM